MEIKTGGKTAAAMPGSIMHEIRAAKTKSLADKLGVRGNTGRVKKSPRRIAMQGGAQVVRSIMAPNGSGAEAGLTP